MDMDQRIVFWNKAAERILGHRRDEVLGKPCHQVLRGVSVERILVCAPNCTVILGARCGKVAPSRSVFVYSNEGRPKWISISHVLLPLEHFNCSLLLNVFHETTDEMEARRVVQGLERLLSGSSRMSIPPKFSEPRANGTLADLTPRELEVVKLLAEGQGTREIAQSLSIALATARNHIQHVLSKLGAHTRHEVVAVAFRQNLI